MTDFEKYSLLINGFQTLAVILGFVVAYHQLSQLRRDSRNSLELASRERAMNLIARYSDPAYLDWRYRLRTDTKAQADPTHCAYILNFFEELGMTVKHGIANEDLLKDFFATILKQWMEEKYMQDTLAHIRKNDQAVFENLAWLQKRWEERREPFLTISRIPPLESRH